MIFGTDAKVDVCLQNHVSVFLIFGFSDLNYIVKLPDWPVPGYHGNRIKNPET